MKNMTRRLIKLISADPWRDRESAYLNGSTSIVDLEMRMREIDSGRFRNRL